MEFSGRLAAFPPGDLLQWARNDRRTGALVVRRTDREKRVYFHAGDVVGCLSTNPDEFYGQYLLVNGHLDQRQLLRALSECTKSSRRLGVVLLDQGLLAPEVVQQTLRRQIEDLVCDLFLWERGVFYFRSEMPPDEEILPEPIDTIGLAMQGARWVDELSRIRRVLVHDNVVLARGAQWPGKGLSPLEQRVAEAVGGERTLGEVCRTIRGSYFRLLDAAFRLCVGSVLDITSVGEDADRTTQEMSLHDVLLEEATEEQVLVARRHMAVPLELLERCFPVWVGEPTSAEKGRMPARARDFYARFDGQTSLGEAFSADARQRGRELDLLMLQLQKGSLALLPAPLDRLERKADQRGESPLKRWWRRITSAAPAAGG